MKKSIGSRFIKISNKNDQSSEETLTVEPERLPLLYPHPHGCLPLSTYIRANRFGRESLGTRKKIGAKVYLRSEDQQEQENIQKLSSSDQRSCLCKGKSCLM